MTQANMTELLQEAGNPDQRNADLWAQCFVEADGDEGKAKALYVKAKLPKQEPAPQKAWCPNCGAQCLSTDTFCANCKMHMTGEHRPVAEKPKPYIAPRQTSYSGDSQTHNLVKTAKSRGIYIILGIFFGMLGIHNFYAGRYARGVWQLLCTMILGWFVVGLFITAIWVIVDLFTIKTDGADDPMA